MGVYWFKTQNNCCPSATHKAALWTNWSMRVLSTRSFYQTSCCNFAFCLQWTIDWGFAALSAQGACCQEDCCCAAVLYRHKGITPSQHPQSSTVCESWFVKAVPQPDCWAPVQAPLRNSLHPESKDVLNYCVIACIVLLWQTNPSSVFLLPPINTHGTKIISQKQHERSF